MAPILNKEKYKSLDRAKIVTDLKQLQAWHAEAVARLEVLEEEIEDAETDAEENEYDHDHTIIIEELEDEWSNIDTSRQEYEDLIKELKRQLHSLDVRSRF